ncbi:hypothetical protein [Nonomuraea typhae]|uniref:Uncharacterized protein n=1 Tax=Nonomuraea typhae TaxID=2603600 RepID=A0ABW7YT17_9ACTN
MNLIMVCMLALPCPAPASATGVLDLKPLRQIAYDYQPYKTPEAMARDWSRVVLAGTSAGWSAGRKKDQVLLRIKVTERFRGTARDEVAFEVYRGIQSLADFRRAVPEGVRLVLAGREKSDQPGVYTTPPQGLILQQVTGKTRKLVYALESAPAWQYGCGIDGLAERLRSAKLS